MLATLSYQLTTSCQALDPCRGLTTPEDISFTNERSVFTQSDMHEGNFFLDMEEKMCLIDFASVALLPESFANLAVRRRDPFVKKVAACLKWPTYNIKSMGRAMELLQTIANKTLGMFICTRD